MFRTTIHAALILGVAASLSGQTDLIYYPFVTGSGTSVTNMYKGGPATGTLSNANTTNSGWVAGKTGFALSGRDSTTAGTGAYVDTGLNIGTKPALLSGSFTIAMFLKERVAVTNTLSYYCTGLGSFRMFTGGVAYEGLFLRAWGGTPADLILYGTTNKPASGPFIDLRAKMAKEWTHVAIVVDWDAKVATWYIDGGAFSTIPITAGANVTTTGNFLVGQHTSASSRSAQDIDEFRLLDRAATPSEVQAWAMAKLQTDTGEVSITAGGTQKMALDLGVANQGQGYWVFGSATGSWPGTSLLGLQIPLNIDAYTDFCYQLTNSPVFSQFRGRLDASGKGAAAFNIPTTTPTSAIGTKLDHAALIYDAQGAFLDVTNNVGVTVVK